MDIGEPPPDPFAGMTPGERKRAWESGILEMAYNLSEFDRVSPRERPDFAVQRHETDRPFGVEVTQLFPSEAIARLNMVPGYYHRLWAGGSHLHKRDVEILQSVKVDVSDKDGNLKHTGVPAIFVTPSSPPAFRRALAEALRTKAAKGYAMQDFSHVDLVILDWFELRFDPMDYSSAHFLDDEVRAALQACPFREVFVTVGSRPSGKTVEIEEETPRTKEEKPDEGLHVIRRHRIPLRQLLLMERLFVTGYIIDEEERGRLRDVAHLNALAIDHISRVQGYGEPVLYEGRTYLRYHGSCAQIGPSGMQVLDFADLQGPRVEATEVPDGLDPEVESRVTERALASTFSTAYAPLANPPTTWKPEG